MPVEKQDNTRVQRYYPPIKSDETYKEMQKEFQDARNFVN